jgi:hypothetical protein
MQIAIQTATQNATETATEALRPGWGMAPMEQGAGA